MKNDEYRILLADDEPDVIEFLGYNLRKEGYQVFSCYNGKEAVEMASNLRPHLVILDVMMPVMDGMVACQEIKKNPDLQHSIIIFLTARGEDYSQIAGFEAGADDYITKPIKPRVLLSRITALLRRYKEPEKRENVLQVSDLIIDKEKHLVMIKGQDIFLPKKEFELLQVLASKPNKVFSREEIFTRVWGNDVIVGERTIDVHIRKIREKTKLQNIKTIKGVGYKFEA
ncbi:MAG: response regulator transcription factor [Bacteroidales bacterium]|nr:response regulator transcription factor [Bacteroidales bacterium]